MRIIATAAAAAFLVFIQPALAKQGNEACDLVASLDPSGVQRALSQFISPILGKRPERWTARDFEILRKTVTACGQYRSAAGHQLEPNRWITAIESAKRVVLPVSEEIERVDVELARIKARAPWLPECIDLLKWKRDRSSWVNTSVEIFGRDLLDMSIEELGFARRAAESCRSVMDKIAVARGAGQRKRAGELIADDLIYAIDKSIEGVKEKDDPTIMGGLTVTRDGRRIPLSYISPKGRMMVAIVNRSIELNRSLSASELEELAAWIETVAGNDTSQTELAYANAVKEIISRQVFR